MAQDTKLVAEHGRKESKDLWGDKRGWYDISINYSLSPMQEEELNELSKINEIDIILVPYPVLNCLKQFGDNMYNPKIMKKERVCKLDDRVTKVIRSDEFCV